MTDTIHMLNLAVDAYWQCDRDDPQRDQLFEAVCEWLAKSYEEDGDQTEQELDAMDWPALADRYIEHRIGTNP